MSEEIIRKYKCDCCSRVWIGRFGGPFGTSRIEISGASKNKKSLDLCRECTQTAMAALFFIGDPDNWGSNDSKRWTG